MAESKEPDKGPYRVFSGFCPDEACKAKLFFPAYDLSIECTACGQRHSRNSLKDIEEVTNPDVALHNIIRKILHSSTKKGADSVRVLGLSNYQCKLVSPLLTRYGMNKQGQAQLLQDMGRGDTFDCTILADRTFLLEPEHIEVNGYGRDRTGSMLYLGDTLAVIKKFNDDEERLLPIHADGDGHCLVHALSRALIGRELFWHALRQNLKEHFISRLDTYKNLFCDFIDVEEWRDIIAECDPNFTPMDGEPLGLRNIHIFGLANVLRRPIILLDSLCGMQSSGDYTGVFLPRLFEPEQCRSKDGHLNRPLCLAWSSSGRNHYIALVPVKGRNLPRLPKWMLPKAWGVPQECVHNYIELDEQGVCTIGSNNCLPDKYVLRLVQAMEKVFIDQFGVSPSLVADVHQYVYKSTGVVGVKPDIVLGETQRRVHEKRLYRCLGCNAINIFTILLDGLQPDGSLYQLAEKIHGKLNPAKTYAFPLHGLVCRYDAELDRLVPEEARCELKHCKFCQGQELRTVSGDGTVQYKNGDCTNVQATQHPSCQCQCGFKHFWDGRLYDNLPRELPVKLEWGDKTVAEVVTWFQFESDTSLNSNVYEEAQQRVQKHFPGAFGSERLVQKVVDSILRQTATKDDSDTGTPVLDDSDWNPYSSSKIIMSGRQTQSIHKEELTKCETERKLAQQIEQKAGQEQSRKKVERMNRLPTASTSSTISIKHQKMGGAVPSTSTTQVVPDSQLVTQTTPDAKVTSTDKPKTSSGPGQKKVRVSTSDGRQSTLTMEQDTTYASLQAQLDDEFSVPAARQRIKHGFPPRELQAPSAEDADQPLAISHGDRITLEILPDPAAAAPAVDLDASCVPSPMSRSMQSSLTDDAAGDLLKTLSDIQNTPADTLDPQIASLNLLASLTGRDLWTYVQTMPAVFSHGGVFYEQVKRDLGLTDGKHCTLPWLPGKTFRYNESTDMLELCLEPHGHFPITSGIEQRVLGHPVPPTSITPHSPREEPPDLSKILGSGSSGVVVNPQLKFPRPKPQAFTGVGHTLAPSPAPSTSAEPTNILRAREEASHATHSAATSDQKSVVSMEIDKVKESSEKAASEAVFQRVGPGYTVLNAQQSNEANITSEMFQNIAKTIQAAMMETETDEGVDDMSQGELEAASTSPAVTMDTTSAVKQTLDDVAPSRAEGDSHVECSISNTSPAKTLETVTMETLDTHGITHTSASSDNVIAPIKTMDSETAVPVSHDTDVSLSENEEAQSMCDSETVEHKHCDENHTAMAEENQNVEVQVPEETMDISEPVNGLEDATMKDAPPAELSPADVHIEVGESRQTESKPAPADTPNGPIIQS